MQPPVALLVYAPDRPAMPVYYPFAVFSPEWQAIHYGLTHQVPVRFMDLPQAHQLALRVTSGAGRSADRDGRTPTSGQHSAPPNSADPELPIRGSQPRRDPLGWLAEAAGYSDGERWWEHMVEQRRDGDRPVRRDPGGDDGAARSVPAERRPARSPARGLHAADDPRRAAAKDSRGSRSSAAPGTRRRWRRCRPTREDAALPQGAAEGAACTRPGCPGPTAGSTFASGYGAGIESPGLVSPPLDRAPDHVADALDDARGPAAARRGPGRLVGPRHRGGAAGRDAGGAARPAAAGPARAERGDADGLSASADDCRCA